MDEHILRVDGAVVVPHLEKAGTSWTRMRGLLGRAELPEGHGLWIVPCPSIHMFFMRFAIDAVFLDRDLRVVKVCDDVRPWRMARGGRGARSVLELPAGTAGSHGIGVGSRCEIELVRDVP
jgi:uncharacterized membrane protein (UPF0127 family)